MTQATGRRIRWPDRGAFRRLGGRLAEAVGPRLAPRREPSLAQAHPELVQAIARTIAAQLGMAPCEVSLGERCRGSGVQAAGGRPWHIELDPTLCEERSLPSLLDRLAGSVLEQLQTHLYEEWAAREETGRPHPRGVDWRLARSWCARSWRELDRREALDSYLRDGFWPALHRRRPPARGSRPFRWAQALTRGTGPLAM